VTSFALYVGDGRIMLIVITAVLQSGIPSGAVTLVTGFCIAGITQERVVRGGVRRSHPGGYDSIMAMSAIFAVITKIGSDGVRLTRRSGRTLRARRAFRAFASIE
jgi:hypothetical protein